METNYGIYVVDELDCTQSLNEMDCVMRYIAGSHIR